jgi:hypothetical protein
LAVSEGDHAVDGVFGFVGDEGADFSEETGLSDGVN